MYKLKGQSTYFFVSQANYEEFLTSTKNDNCYWSGPMKDTDFYPVDNGIGPVQEQCYDAKKNITFGFGCHSYDTYLAQ